MDVKSQAHPFLCAVIQAMQVTQGHLVKKALDASLRAKWNEAGQWALRIGERLWVAGEVGLGGWQCLLRPQGTEHWYC